MVVSDDENHEDSNLDRQIDAAYAELEANEPDAANASLAAGRNKDPPKPPKILKNQILKKWIHQSEKDLLFINKLDNVV